MPKTDPSAHRWRASTFTASTSQRERAEHLRGLGRAAIAEQAANKAHRVGAAVAGRSWWECDRDELNRRAAARFPAGDGKLPRENF